MGFLNCRRQTPMGCENRQFRPADALIKPCLLCQRRVIIVREIPLSFTYNNMKFKTDFRPTIFALVVLGVFTLLATSCSTCCKKSGGAPNTLTAPEKADGWQLLWDGKTTHGWRSPKSDEFPAKSWLIQDGVLSVVSSGNAESQAGGDIITRERYANFELKADFMITTGCNSGIKIFVQPNLSPIDKVTGKSTGVGSAIGLEYQILDDANHPDAKLGRDGDRTLGSLYDLIPAAADKKVLPVGKWNHARIVSQDKHVEFWLNGEKTVEFDRGSPEFRAAVAESKFKNIPDFGEWPDGHILLQEHGSVASFCNIKIRKLPAN
jgi:Domain of Unknown Function (DUF1080)